MKEISRMEIPALCGALEKGGAVIAEVCRELRYVWILNPHPDFDPAAATGKRDDDLLPREAASEIMSLKREVFRTGEPTTRILRFPLGCGPRYYSISAFPIREPDGSSDRILTIGFDSAPEALQRTIAAARRE